MSNIIKITIIDREGKKHVVDAPTDMGLSIMELCKANDIPVEGTCGGMALCATCQLYNISATLLPEQSDEEMAMLDQAFHVKPNSRLGCQIRLTREIDGLVVELAPEE